jgi:thiol-disulfide isomerase/thioredoxin
MKTPFTRILLSLLLAWPAALVAQADTPAGTPADKDFAAFEALQKTPPPASPKEMGSAAFMLWADAHQQKVGAAGFAFYANHPTDPRRWDVVLAVSRLKPMFIKDAGPDFATQGLKGAVIDEAAKAAWKEKNTALWQALNAATDVPPGPAEERDWSNFAFDFRAATAALKAGGSPDWAAFRTRFDAHAAKYSQMEAILAKRAGDYLGALERNLPGRAAAEWQHLLDTSAIESLRKLAGDQLKLIALMSQPLDIAFTAVDGRKVDLKDLRGKVVLIDFWATWCGPCIAELPNVKKVYSAYRDRGFEVVGIALENGKLAPTDTPEQAAAKLEAARKILTDFTAKEEMPWPQYFDGKYWKNDFAVQFDIRGIPAMFLLDQTGKVVTTNARGPKLEAEVKRLLKL